MIPVDEPLLQVNAYKTFLSQRRKLIAERLNAFLAEPSTVAAAL
jgi:hypothetical protein